MAESFDHPATLEVWRKPVFWVDVAESAGVEVIGVIIGLNSAMRAVGTVSSMEDARYVTRALRAYAASDAGRADPDRPR